MGQKLPKVRTIVLMSDRRQLAAKDIKAVGEYEDLLASMSAEYDFPDLDENTQATTFYTTGTTGVPKGVYFSHRQIVLRHPGGTRHLWICVATRWARPPRRLYADDPHVPRPCLGSTVVSTAAGLKQVYPGRYAADFLVKLIKAEGVTFTHGVPTLLEDATGGSRSSAGRLGKLDNDDRRLRFDQNSGGQSSRPGPQCPHWIRNVGERPIAGARTCPERSLLRGACAGRGCLRHGGDCGSLRRPSHRRCGHEGSAV